MKIVVVGGVAGGASTAARARRIDAQAEIIIFERGEHASYSNCSLPYYLGGVVKDEEALIMMTPDEFRSQQDLDLRLRTEVISIDRAAKKVVAKNLETGEEYEESYDKLVLAPGAEPVKPASIKGIDGANIYTIRNVTDIRALKAKIAGEDIKDVTVIGGGFIGIEAAENLAVAGKNVTIIEGLNQIMAPFDYDMVQILHKEIIENDVKLILSGKVTEITPDAVIAEKNGEAISVKADAVVLAIGVAPETKLAREAGLEIGDTRGIKVNKFFQTSDPDIYAVGDAVESYNSITGNPGRLALAGPAQRAARLAANHMYGIEEESKGFIGSSCIKIFGMNAASTGLNEKTAKAAGINFDYVMVIPNDKVGIMPDAHWLTFKLLFEVPTGKLIGAQAIGRGAADKRIDVIASMITMGATLADLRELELCYSPVFSTAKDVVNMAALVGQNILDGKFKQVHVNEVRGLVESGAYIIDVREADEYAAGHIKTAVNVPLSEIRDRLDEIPTDRPVYLHCRSSQRSYYAVCALQGRGFTNIVNISGSFLGISLHEYFNDVDQGRDPIVTAYNFN